MIRRLGGDPAVYLTFDDGLDAQATPAVLDVLKRHQANATFFLIAERLEGREELLARVLAEGHAIGNHSLDHRYRRYFAGRSRIRSWLNEAEIVFERFGVREKLVGFRPPAGILTPPLVRELRARGEPLVLWNERFYDAVFTWTEAKAKKSAARLQGGSIVLLHDRQEARRLPSFLKTLDVYISELKARGFELRALERNRLV